MAYTVSIPKRRGPAIYKLPERVKPEIRAKLASRFGSAGNNYTLPTGLMRRSFTPTGLERRAFTPWGWYRRKTNV